MQRKKYLAAVLLVIALDLTVSVIKAFAPDESVFFSLIGESISAVAYKTESKKNFFSETLNAAIHSMLNSSVSAYSYLSEGEKIPLSNSTPITQNPLTVTEVNKNQYSDIFFTDNPKVVIYHTHTTECYLFDPEATSYRSTDSNENLVKYGKLVAEVLYREYNIQTVHLEEIFDLPYDTAYEKSAQAVENLYAKYPGIIYAIDIHRDGVSKTDDNFFIYRTQIAGNNIAKMMLVLGTNSDKAPQNRVFANKIQSTCETLYPGMFRKILEKPYIYNQNIIEKSILVELGSNLTSPEEARIGAIYLGRVLGEVISSEKSPKE